MRIFISYGRKDTAGIARKLAIWLRAEGYEPWIDVENGIPLGAPFDHRIEVGISNSDMLIALLSPWSVRPESFCRNEILYAQALTVKVPIIPVLMADVVPPIQIISLNYVDARPGPDVILQKLPSALSEVARTRKMPLREWASGQANAPWWAARESLNFEEELAFHGGAFIGRAWLFSQIQNWMTVATSRMLLLTADAGVGKSAIAAQMTACLNVRGVHFCSRSNIESCRPAAWVAGLTYQLAAQFPQYRNAIERLPAPNWGDPTESLFRTLVADPLRGCQDQMSTDEPWVFVVDGLDESMAAAGPGLSDLLADSARRIPAWLRIIVTCRPDQTLLARFRVPEVHRIHLDALSPANREDLGSYSSARIEQMVGEGSVPDRRDSLARMADVSAGNFLFARMTLDALGDPDPPSRLELDDIGKLPSNLGGLYHAMFRKRFPSVESYEREVLPLLECLVTARGPLPEGVLLSAAGIDLRTFRKGLRALSQFLSQTEAGTRVFHWSLADWLADHQASGEYGAAAEEGHRRLAHACWQEYARASGMSPYTLAYLPRHLRESASWDALETVLTDIRFIEAKCRAGMTYHLIADYAFALDAFPGAQATSEKAGGRQRQVSDYIDGLVGYAQAWHKTRKANGDGREDPLTAVPPDRVLPQVVPSVRPWLEEEIDAEAPRVVRSASGWDRIHAFEHFVNSEAHNLARYSVAPMFCAQQAYNHADAGPINAAGRQALGAGEKAMVVLYRSASLPEFNPRPAVLRTIQDTGWVFSVSMTPDGHVAVSSGEDKKLRVWKVNTGRLLNTLDGHTQPVWSISLTPDGRLAVSGSEDATVRIWDVVAGQCVRILEGHSSQVWGVGLTPDGRLAVSGSSDTTLRIWDVDTGRCLRTLTAHSSSVLAVTFTPDGRLAVSGNADATLRLWDLETGVCLRTLTGHTRSVWAVSITPDGRLAVSASEDRTVRVWDIETGQCLRVLAAHTDWVRSISLTPDGRLAVSASDDKTLRVWEVETGNCLRTLVGHSALVFAVSLAADGRLAVSGSADGTLRVWDIEAGRCVCTPPGHTDWIRAISLTLDGRLAVSASDDTTLRVWEVETGRCLHVLQGNTRRVGAVSLSPDGRLAVSGGDDEILRVWDLKTGQCLRTIPGHVETVTCVSFTPDGREGVSGSEDKTLRCWDFEAGRCLRTFGEHPRRILAVSVTPDGRLAISGCSDALLRVWDLATGRCLQTIEGHSHRIWAVSVTPDGRFLVSGSEDNTLRLWDLASGRCLRVFAGHSDTITAVNVTTDGLMVISGSVDGSLRLWSMETGNCLAIAAFAGPITACASRGKLLAIGDSLGGVYFLDIQNRMEGVPYATAVRLWLYGEAGNSGGWDSDITGLCPSCGNRFAVMPAAVNTIQRLSAHLHSDQAPCITLPAEASTEPELRSKCPCCQQPLRLNPFARISARSSSRDKHLDQTRF